jgi:DNA-binding GntR family transcriptional regulator
MKKCIRPVFWESSLMGLPMNKLAATAKKIRKEPAEKISLGQSAYLGLEESIITMQLTPGAFFSESDLMRRFNYGRTPMREALQRLERERLVKIIPRRGILVAELNLASQLKLLEARRELERPLSGYAAARATIPQKKNLQGFIAQIQAAAETNDAPGFIRSSKDMYSELILAANNEYFQALDLFHGLSRRFWFAHQRGPDDLRDVVNAHTTRVKAIIQGDADRARNATDKLMDHLETFARNTISRS